MLKDYNSKFYSKIRTVKFNTLISNDDILNNPKINGINCYDNIPLNNTLIDNTKINDNVKVVLEILENRPVWILTNLIETINNKLGYKHSDHFIKKLNKKITSEYFLHI